MKLPNESHSSWTHISFSSFTWASLSAWSEFPFLPQHQRTQLTEMASSAKLHIDEVLREARQTQEVLLFARPLAQARQNATQLLLKRTTSSVLATLVDRVGLGSRDHPQVREFLPGLLGSITEAPLAERPTLVSHAAARLQTAATAPDFEAEKTALVERLRQAATLAEQGVSAAEAAWSAWTTERSEEVVAKGRLRLELERIHGQLRALFPGQRELVESFFLKGERPSEGTGEPEEPDALTP